MASLAGTGSKGQSKGKAPETGLEGIQKSVLRQQIRQNRKVFRVQQPVRREIGRQTREALRTGGVGAQIPIIQRAVEQSSLAGSQAMRDAESGLAASGLTGTPFGQRILAQLSGQTRFATSQLPTQFAQSLISAAGGGTPFQPSFSTGGGGTGPGGAKDTSGFGTILGALIQKKL